MSSRVESQSTTVDYRQAGRFSAVIIGETTLPVQCGEILLEKGHTICGMVSSDAQVADWAVGRGVERLEPSDDLVRTLRRTPFDYLFSINNLSVLDMTLVVLPRRWAINFHDGPLPRYAGLNAPSWAILKRETAYGIAWHLMSGEVDQGDILVRRPVSISPGDTSLTLSAKCYEAAIDAFRELVEDLTTDGIHPVAQNLTHRTYFARHARPPAACFLRWDRPADELSALVRSLDLGTYPNPLGLAKLLAGDEVIVVSSLDVVPKSGAESGTITALSEPTIQIATATDDIVVGGLSTLEGRAVPVHDLVQSHRLVEGSQLSVLDDRTANALGDVHRSLAEHEPFWTEQLANLEPLGVPYGRAMGTPRGERYSQSASWLSAGILDTLLRIDSPARPADLLLGALATYLCRLEAKGSCHLGLQAEQLPGHVTGSRSLVAQSIPLCVEYDPSLGFDQAWEQLRHRLRTVRSHRTYLRDLVMRHPRLRDGVARLPVLLGIGPCDGDTASGADLRVFISEDDGKIIWSYRPDVLDKRHVELMQRQLETFVSNVAASPSQPVGEIPLLNPDEERRVLVEWNNTAMPYDSTQCVHQLVEMQATRTPEAIAVVAGERQLTYAELDVRANQLANYLQGLGAGVGALVGISVKRSVDMVVGLLGILKSGAAYVPIDAEYPAQRIAFIVRDAKAQLLVSTGSVAAGLERDGVHIARLDADAEVIDRQSREPARSEVAAEDLAYVIYTSGSTGSPKGVMVTHRNVLNFFHAMDRRLDHDKGGSWLALTTISFDISVLELFWTLARGFKVVVYTGEESELPAPRLEPVQKTPDFSLFYFGASQDSSPEGKYRLLLEGSRFGDESDFAAVWTPERHFHAFGGLYPNPSVIGAAIATVTKRIRIRAGSVVSPLHHAIRIAEEWSAVDNLSGGRVGISFASGWQPDDFVLAPENFQNRKDVMLRQIDMVRRLWRGESIRAPGPLGQDVQVRTLPRPIQPELPVWITSAGSPDTFRAAGEAGCNVLTHLLGQSVEEVAKKIRAYREAWRASGRGPGAGHVTLMLHAFVGDSDDDVKEQVRAPMKAYLLSSVGLIQRAAWTFPAFKRATTDQEGRFALDHLSPSDLDAVLDFSFERYYETSGLLGSRSKCLRLIDQLIQIGVDEIACLIDFIDDVELALSHLPRLDAVRAQTSPRVIHTRERITPPHPVARLIEEHGVTHLQCTPSMATLLLASPGTRPALETLQQLLIGGEALPIGLARELRQTVRGSIINMYGPTEATIWSSTHQLGQDDWSSDESVPIGRPIGNTQFYVLDSQLRPVPVGLIGELFIGGDGVARGYLDRPDLNAQRFISNPFGRSGDRLYRTGDLVRYRDDGSVQYIGRVDNQVKLRGYRVELGEIESVLSMYPGVRESAVLIWGGDSGQQRLVAYVVARDDRRLTVEELRGFLADRLPEYMVPGVFEFLEIMPQTPNKKIDRQSLREPRQAQVDSAYGAPRDEVERTLVEIWKRELRVESVGVNDDFFQLGGHSLLAMRVFNEIERMLGRRLPLATLFTAPTVGELADILRKDHWVPQWTALVAIQTEGSRPPFFGVHDLGGQVLMYQGLARHLGPDQPFFGLQAVGLDGSLVPYHRYEDIAHHYIKEMRSVQPHGPYFLGGECLGGSLAFEVARQLDEQGEEIALLAMIDSFHPAYPKRKPYMPEAAYRALHRSRAVDFRPGKLFGLVAGKMGHWGRRYDPSRRTEAALEEAYAAYRPQAFGGTITLFRSQRLPPGIEPAPLMGWDELALGGVEVHELATYFNTALAETNVEILARELRNCIDRRLNE